MCQVQTSVFWHALLLLDASAGNEYRELDACTDSELLVQYDMIMRIRTMTDAYMSAMYRSKPYLFP